MDLFPPSEMLSAGTTLICIMQFTRGRARARERVRSLEISCGSHAKDAGIPRLSFPTFFAFLLFSLSFYYRLGAAVSPRQSATVQPRDRINAIARVVNMRCFRLKWQMYGKHRAPLNIRARNALKNWK